MNNTQRELREQADNHRAAAERLIGPQPTKVTEAGQLRDAIQALAHVQLAIYLQQSAAEAVAHTSKSVNG